MMLFLLGVLVGFLIKLIFEIVDDNKKLDNKQIKQIKNMIRGRK